MYYAKLDENYICSLKGDLPGQKVHQLPSDVSRTVFLFERDPLTCRDAFAVTHPCQLSAQTEDVTWLASESLPSAEKLPLQVTELIRNDQLRAVNKSHPRWRELLNCTAAEGKKRVNIIAVGDVGGTVLIGLRLLGGDILSSIGIYDLSPTTLDRWEFEVGQVYSPWTEYQPPHVAIIDEENIFDCDMLVFCATGGVPPLAEKGDVRLAQLAVNSRLVSHYAKLARQRSFGGIFAVVSDPVDLLCRIAWLESNRNHDGRWDGKGLFTAQVEGYGLGVMYARAAYYARRDSRFAAFLNDGAAYGPHGSELVIANSLSDYDDDLSRELTRLAAEANLEARSRDFKPFIAPALSSAAYQILDTLRGRPHLGATMLGDIFFGAVNRRGPSGIEVFSHPLPQELLSRIQYSAAVLQNLGEHYE